MRLIGTFKEVGAAQKLSQALSSKGIENVCEGATITDWGSAEYGDPFFRIWIIDEDRLEESLKLNESFLANELPSQDLPKAREKQIDVESLSALRRRLVAVPHSDSSPSMQRMGSATLYLILLCSLLYFWTVIETRTQDMPAVSAHSSAVATPVRKALLFDYPKAYEILDQFAALARENQWKDQSEINLEGQKLLNEFAHTPFWRGFYNIAVQYLKGEPWLPLLSDPRFEKIHEGELWRLWSPVPLHSDLLHIAFNMIWLMVLGKQMEFRLGIKRYLLFCLLVGVFSNTIQYLMAGPNFIGFSGILCGMLAYIWVRMKKSPWEGYQLQSGSFLFLSVFILAMLSLQIISFVGEVYWSRGIASGIANTAHFSGAFAGYVLGHFRYFAWSK